MRYIKYILLFLFLSFFTSACAFAQTQIKTIINVDESADKPVLVALIPFSYVNNTLESQGRLHQLIYENIRISGALRPFPVNKMLSRPNALNEVRYSEWEQEAVEYLVLGQISLNPLTQKVQVTASIVDVFQRKEILTKDYFYEEGAILTAANSISNDIFKLVTGVEGVFYSKIAYVESDNSREPRHRIFISNLNGSGAKMIVQRRQPIFSLSWSNDGKKLAYVSYENNMVVIYIHDLRTGNYQKFTNNGRGASAPRWDRDDKRLAFASSSINGTDIYLLDLTVNKVTKLTNARNGVINTEPFWFEEGNKLLFTSDRIGWPTPMEYNLNSKQQKRILSDTTYTLMPKYLSEDRVLFVKLGDDRVYSLYHYYMNIEFLEQITTKFDIESFDISKNKEYLVYTESLPGGRGGAIKFMHLKTKQSFLFLRNRPNKILREAIWSPN